MPINSDPKSQKSRHPVGERDPGCCNSVEYPHPPIYSLSGNDKKVHRTAPRTFRDFNTDTDAGKKENKWKLQCTVLKTGLKRPGGRS
jgi:hypothetical protein